MNLTLTEFIEGVEKKTLDPKEVALTYAKKAKNEDSYNAFISTADDYVAANVDDFADKVLHAAPIAVKDIILVEGTKTTNGSTMLKNYDSPYTATCIKNLEKHGGLTIGKANMDDAAMGTSTETSAFGRVTNPHGTNRMPGGSSGGSCAAVAGDLCIAALGTDTGGSVRQPAAMCGVVGMKPTYGRVARYGVIAMASSLDQVGTITKTVNDAQLLMRAIAGYSDDDAVMQERDEDMLVWAEEVAQASLEGIKIAVPKEFYGEGLDPQIEKRLQETIEELQKLGATIEEVSMPTLEYSVATYYAIQPAEASTNLARYDGIKFGLQDDTFAYDNIKDYYRAIRSKGFGQEVKRRILLGTYTLSAANYEGLYLKAQQVREKMRDDFRRVFADYHVVLGPTAPTAAWKMEDKPKDPLTMYKADVYTIPANLTGIPAISIPTGTIDDEGEQMPVAMQVMADHRREDLVFRVGAAIERVYKN